ncbi:MAG: TerB family tellurite resistance protein [Rhodospirillales bacterium]|nr:TerB family tellurite resistance protein [Rhodospirillales bacterium]
MISGLKSLLFGKTETGETQNDVEHELHLAAAALMIEAATLDGSYADAERDTISRVLRAQFDLDAGAVDALIEKADAKVSQSIQILGFTKVIKDRLEPEERAIIMEMLWEVAYADGEVHDYEASLVRRVAGLLYVTDKESGAARKRVLARLDSGT